MSVKCVAFLFIYGASLPTGEAASSGNIRPTHFQSEQPVAANTVIQDAFVEEMKNKIMPANFSKYQSINSAVGELFKLPYSIEEPNATLKYDPETRFNASGLISSKGYPVEDHEVITVDGFILGMQRIPHGIRNNHGTGKRPAVLLQHGLLGTSANWVENLANQSLGFILADAGFDVWLGNVRGNTYSLKHVSLKKNMKKFWYWTWDEMAKYDLPAMINYVLNVTGKEQLFYVGHSQGTTIAFSAFSRDHELGKKVKTFFALGPVTTVEYITCLLRVLVDTGVYKKIVESLEESHDYDYAPHTRVMDLVANTVCDNDDTVILCQSVIFLLAGGYSYQHMNASRIPVYVANNPAGTSIWNMEHWAQMVKSGEFVMYDYGCLGNLKHYGQLKPPRYHVEDMLVPTAIFWGDRDTLATPKDILRMIPKIQNLVYNKRIPTYAHVDFVWAIDAADIVYNDIIRLMKASA